MQNLQPELLPAAAARKMLARYARARKFAEFALASLSKGGVSYDE